MWLWSLGFGVLVLLARDGRWGMRGTYSRLPTLWGWLEVQGWPINLLTTIGAWGQLS